MRGRARARQGASEGGRERGKARARDSGRARARERAREGGRERRRHERGGEEGGREGASEGGRKQGRAQAREGASEGLREVASEGGRREGGFPDLHARIWPTPEFGLGQMRPHARAGSELAPRGCFLWYKEAHHKAPVHVRTRHARSWPAPPKPGISARRSRLIFFQELVVQNDADSVKDNRDNSCRRPSRKWKVWVVLT